MKSVDTEVKSTIHSDPKKMPFTVTAKRQNGFSFKVASLNFNNAAFQRDAGYDDKDFERRVMVLKKLIKSWASDGVSIIHLQEISGRFMKLETLRHHLMSELPDSWTTTGPIGRHGDPTKCLNLVTLWDAAVFHLDSLKNFHFSENGDGKAGDKLVSGIQATSNALITAFSPIIPLMATNGGLHTGGLSIDTDTSLVTVNCHLPLRGKLKVACLQRLFAYLNATFPPDQFGRIVSGDMNLFEDETVEAAQMLRMFFNFGDTGCKWTPTGLVYDTASGGTRQTTFIGMKHDLKTLMKRFDPDEEPKKFDVWCGGQAWALKNFLGAAPWPLDWFLASQDGPVSMTGCVVLETSDLKKLDSSAFDTWIGTFSGKQPDYGNYLSDHLPLVATFLM